MPELSIAEQIIDHLAKAEYLISVCRASAKMEEINRLVVKAKKAMEEDKNNA